jgi:hypothetical protein
MDFFRRCLAALLLLGALDAARADELAFVTAQSPIHALLIYDVATMTERQRITGLGIDPTRMVGNADRSRLYLVSRVNASGTQPAEMRVHVVNPWQRRVLRTAVVGEATGRAIGISPDGSRLYVWKLVSATQTFGVAVLDAATLAEVGFVPLPWTMCATVARDLAVAPDGRIVASGCGDGLRVIDPVSLAPLTLPLDADLLNDVLGFTTGGMEVLMRRNGTNATVSNTLLAAIDLATGVRHNVTFALPVGSPTPVGVPIRMVRVRRPADDEENPTVFVTYSPPTGAGSPAIASTSSNSMTPPDRRLTRLTSLGTPSATILGASFDGRVGVLANNRVLRRVDLDPGGSEPIAPSGDPVEVTPTGTPLGLSDIVLVRPLLEDGFE